MQKFNYQLAKEDIKGNLVLAQTLLRAHYPYFLDFNVTEGEESLILESHSEHLYDWQEMMKLDTEEKLRHLINIGQIFPTLNNSKYSYHFTPDNLVFDLNASPLLIRRGIVWQVFPFEPVTEEQFVQSLKAMVLSLLDKKTDYESLMSGKLDFYKGNLFCEKVLAATSLEEIIALLQEFYEEEKKKNQTQFSKINNKKASFLKISSIVSIVIAVISLLATLYLLMFALPHQEMIADLRLAYINKDYSAVVSEVKDTDSKSFSQEDKYILAYSVIMTEPLTDEQRTELSSISTQSNADYLRYWILIGQAKIDDAIDIASYLDDPQLLMYGMTKKIDEIQRNPELSSEERTTQLESYKTKLEELKKQYLSTEEQTSADAATSGTESK